MDLGLQDRVAVVLASTSGLGLAVARALLAEGARVALSGRDPERLARALGELAEHGERVHGEPLDVTDGPAMDRHLAGVAERWGPVQVLVTNAGGPPPATALEVDDAGLSRSLDLTLRSAVRAVGAVLPGMRAAGWGRVVALTSISVRQPIPTLAYSNVMRAGLTAWLKTLARDVAADGVLVNSVCTGYFATERLEELFADSARAKGTTPEEAEALAAARIPAGRLGDPRELGDLVAFLCSERCSYLSGVALAYDGGLDTALL
jgi:3-oxoacyl-[acyl-carrier protein] reductase